MLLRSATLIIMTARVQDSALHTNHTLHLNNQATQPNITAVTVLVMPASLAAPPRLLVAEGQQGYVHPPSGLHDRFGQTFRLQSGTRTALVRGLYTATHAATHVPRDLSAPRTHIWLGSVAQYTVSQPPPSMFHPQSKATHTHTPGRMLGHKGRQCQPPQRLVRQPRPP